MVYYDRKTYEEHRDVWLWLASKLVNIFTFRRRKLATIDHVAIQVDDIAAAVSWYTANWECDVEWADETWAMLKFNNTRLALVLPDKHPPHFAFLDNCPEKAGAPTVHRDGTSSVYTKDPWGNNLELLKRP